MRSNDVVSLLSAKGGAPLFRRTLQGLKPWLGSDRLEDPEKHFNIN